MDAHEKLRTHIEELVSLTDNEWRFVSDHFIYHKLKKNQFLIHKNQKVDCEYWIIKGLVKVDCIDENNKEYILQFASEEYWTSDHNAFQNKIPANLEVVCIENSEFFCLTFNGREEICREVPAMANFFRIKSHHGYISLQQRVMSMLTESAEERYRNLLEKRPELIQRVPKKMIAAYLGLSRETLSRFRL